MDLIALMQRIQQGDREAFATLYARYNKPVFRIAYEATGSADEAVAIVKTVFKEVYQSIRENGPYTGDVNSWMDALAEKHLKLREQQHEEELKKAKTYSDEEARALEDRVDARIAPEAEEAPKPGKKRDMISFIVLCVFGVFLLWVLTGLLSKLQILPKIDLGYEWFNETFFKLF